MAQAQGVPHRRTESAYEGGAQEMYVSYDLPQRTRGGGTAIYPKVKRVYIPGDVVEWAVGRFRKRSGREVHGVRITYRVRGDRSRDDLSAKQGRATNVVRPASLRPMGRRYTQVIGLPEEARNVQLHEAQDPHARRAMQSAR
jgi:hypothetical protein